MFFLLINKLNAEKRNSKAVLNFVVAPLGFEKSVNLLSIAQSKIVKKLIQINM